jgi:6-phosphogluconolactonase (cycloisomerase 2 family)
MTIQTAASVTALLALAGAAMGQAAQRAAFVGNNGNIEGSVTSYTFSPAGVPQFVAKLITGSGQNNPGNNVTGISLSPNGRWLATTHATSSTTVERVSIFRVNADATLTPAGVFTTPDSPLDAVWIKNDVLAVTRTNTSLADFVYVYRYDEAGPSFTEIDSEDAGTFTAYVERSPDGQWLVATDSQGLMIRTFRIESDGELTPGVATSTGGTYVLDPGFTRTGRLRLYGGGGISNSGNKIPAFDFDMTDGTCTPLAAAPFISPGNGPSPKLAVATNDGRFMLVGHGTSSEVRTFFLNEVSGELTDSGFAFDVGIQGDLGDVEVLGDLVLVTDKFSTPNTGLYSFRINQDGAIVMNGGLVSSQGTTPTGIAAWDPPVAACFANCDLSTGNPVLTGNDFACFLNAFVAGQSYANCDGSTGLPVLTGNDFVCFQTRFVAGCG